MVMVKIIIVVGLLFGLSRNSVSEVIIFRNESPSSWDSKNNNKIDENEIVDLVPYPCPFDPSKESIKIRYVLDNIAEKVSINIYDMSGRLVKTIVHNQQKAAGMHEEDTWDGTNYAGEKLANGIYFCEIIAKEFKIDGGQERRYTALAIFGK
ncbi:MAG: FlgD immunoglobulin-like domain containing protein [Elusimicrobiota bacterium]